MPADPAIRPLAGTEVEQFVDELWLPFAREMADLDSYHALADGARAAAIEYRRDRLPEDDSVTLVAVESGRDTDGATAADGTAQVEETLLAYAAAGVSEPAPVFAHDDVVHVSGVYVRPEDRGQGLATRLLDRVEAWGRDRGCGYADLTVDRVNESAIECYRSRDYAVERHTMRKRLE